MTAGGGRVDRALHWFAIAWGALFLLVNAGYIATLFVGAPTIHEGWEAVWGVYSDGNNLWIELVFASPALMALCWLDDRRPRDDLHPEWD
jgi:hypothetical protein